MKSIFKLTVLIAALVPAGMGTGCGARDYADKPASGDAGASGIGDRPLGTSTGDAAFGDRLAVECQFDEILCHGTCVRNDDPTACGTGCVDCTGLPNVKASAVQCKAGICVVPSDGCLPGHAHCSTNPSDVCETDTTKPENCGGCGQNCAAAAPLCASVGGAPMCVLNCSGAAPDKCGSTCVDLKSDVNNCGACGMVCIIPNGLAACVNGACVLSKCRDGYGDCTPDPGCETQLTSVNNCGACGKSCLVANGSAACLNSSCGQVTCNQGWGNCDNNPDCETPLTTPVNCGKCGTACDANKPLCSTVNGQQTCVSDCTVAAPTKCGNACVDTNRDPANCGGCNKPCSFPNADATCSSGACTQGQCKAGFADCSAAQPGCETPLGTNTNCGRCGDACVANSKCDPNSHICVDICTGGGTGNAGHCCSAADCPANLPICSGHICVGKPNGQSCSSGGECAASNCADGVCCDKACTGQCEACDNNGSIGTCTPVNGAPHRNAQPVRALCGGDPPACLGSCNGSTTTKCTYPTGACRSASCSGRLQINGATCDANGICPAPTPTMCQFACITSTGMCGGSCIPDSKQCNGNTPQTCDATGVWQSNAPCSGDKPKCDPTSHSCVTAGKGDSCNSDNQCDTGHCVGGVCCESACTGPCNALNQCPGGACKHLAARTLCGSFQSSQPGTNDGSLICDGNGGCVGATISCNGISCTVDSQHACCTNLVTQSGSMENGPFDCRPIATCGGVEPFGKNCNGPKDCPLGQVCCVTGGFGGGWLVCAPSCPNNGTQNVVCDPKDGNANCPSGMSCAPSGNNYVLGTCG